MGEWTAFDATHSCGEQLLYDGMPVWVSIETSGGWTQGVTLTTEPSSVAEPIPDEAELECPCGQMRRSLAGEVRAHFDQASRRWDREHPPVQAATGVVP
jgi:hypothetical protein